MNLITGCCCFFLLLSVLIPKETEAADRAALGEALKLAGKMGYKLGKMLYYAKCMIENVPRGVKCAKFVIGVGLSANQATQAAQLMPKAQCKPYLGRCSTFQFTKQKWM